MHVARYLLIAFVLLLAEGGSFTTVRAADDSALVAATALDSEAWQRVNATARGLAGMKASGDGGSNWESTQTWQDYRNWIDGRWGYLNRIRLSAMRNWGNGELSGLRNETRTVYYPFSGPDVLYVDTLFPNSKYLLMAGLEPVGTMPDLAALQENGRLGSYLQQVKTSLFTILAASFFKTKDMQNDFHGQVDGLVPAMAVFLARQGYSIDSIHFVSLGGDGTLHDRGEKSGGNGVQITYYRGDRDNRRTLLYFQVNLANDGTPGFARLMQRLGPGVTYLKAASYLLYEDYFSNIRNAILNNSVGVVEDDSGIPFHQFKPDQWEVVPYGNYTGPIALFKEHYQSDLADYYRRNSPSPLSFGSGYKYVASGSSLLVAKKR